MAEFNLIEERWIPCIDLRGERVEYGIRDTLLRAHELREICDDSPLVTVALHRLLLAILYRVHQGPTDIAKWKSLHQKMGFASDSNLDKYFQKWHDRFCLFDDKHPFMQVAALDLNDYKQDGAVKKDNSDGLMRLVREAPDKRGRILFDHRFGTDRQEYEPKQIAKMILSAQSYSNTGVAKAGKLGTQQIKPTPRQFGPCVKGLVLWLQGESLFHTLLLNLVPRNYVEADKPAWEDDSIVQAAINSWRKPTTFAGPVQRFAPLSRFVRVVDRRSIFFTNGLKVDLKADSDDPMKVYSRSDEKKLYKAVELRQNRAAWRDAHTLFSLRSSMRNKPPASMNHVARLAGDGLFAKTAQPRANLVGLATDQGKALLWRHERMPVPIALFTDFNLTERLGGLLQNAEQAAFELNNRTRRIAKLYLAPDAESPGGRKATREELDKVAGAMNPRPAYWARMEEHFFTLLEHLPNDWDTVGNDWNPDDQQSATNTWRKHVKDEARRALEESIRSLGTTSRAIQAVARVRTDFNDDDLKPKPQNAAKWKRKGRGGKKK